MQIEESFLALVRAGLWEEDVKFDVLPKSFNYEKVLRLSEEQTVIGLVVVGVVKILNAIFPLTEKLTLMGKCQLIEQRNESMNRFIVGLVKRM